ncbi:retron St85 family RNA-directed DNA polymerase [Sandarakinorhabdus rubra]|uniref:retron St85 family RNA-directed DNA polymerase n=1 Tax=Sandarakinorhabdus rubra TaxID=2672568 RepID=UPI0013DA5D77|nr:retron St85 family RNA-directed DNA polymerase [Sandarakinorhabdus rubra]
MTSPLITFLMNELHLGEREVVRLILTAPERYKVYQISKRNGGKREIAQPAPEVKAAQRAIVRAYLLSLPVHPSATAYSPGSSIIKNASAHSDAGPILKYDFKDFFPSITEKAWISYCLRVGLFSKEDAVRSGRLLFRRPKGGRILRLSIGAPSSPIVSNLLMYDFDERLSKLLEGHKIVYTRYADDLTFSAPRTGNLLEVPKAIRAAMNSMSHPKLALNSQKTVLVTKRYQRNITGLILTLDGNISVGRSRKRLIRAGIDHFIRGKLDVDQTVKLAGIIAFTKGVEPTFFAKLTTRYGNDVMGKIMASTKDYKRPRPETVNRTKRR